MIIQQIGATFIQGGFINCTMAPQAKRKQQEGTSFKELRLDTSPHPGLAVGRAKVPNICHYLDKAQFVHKQCLLKAQSDQEDRSGPCRTQACLSVVKLKFHQQSENKASYQEGKKKKPSVPLCTDI